MNKRQFNATATGWLIIIAYWIGMGMILFGLRYQHWSFWFAVVSVGLVVLSWGNPNPKHSTLYGPVMVFTVVFFVIYLSFFK